MDRDRHLGWVSTVNQRDRKADCFEHITIRYKILDEIRCVHRFFFLIIGIPRTISWKEVSDSKINFYDNDIILFHSEIEKNWGWDRTKFKLNRWKKIGKTGPNQSYRQFSSFSRNAKREERGDLKIRWKKRRGNEGRQPARQITEWRFVWAGRFVSACRDFHLAPSSSSSSPGQMTRKQGRN